MPTTIKGIYQNGIIELIDKPPRTKLAGVYISFVNFSAVFKKPQQSTIHSEQTSTKDINDIIDKTFGIAPDLPSGTIYENKIRRQFSARIKKLWQK